MCKGEAVLTVKRLREVLDYDPQTGYFTWRKSISVKLKRPHAGAIRKDGYVEIMIDKHMYRANRLAWFWTYWVWPRQIVDHRNNVPTDNSIDNLRLADFSQSSFNVRLSKTNTSGYKGVCFDKNTKKWKAAIKCRNKYHSLGYFDDPQEAHAAYCRAANELHGKFANHGAQG